MKLTTREIKINFFFFSKHKSISILPYSPLFPRDFTNFANIFSAHFAIAEKNCACMEFNFGKLKIK